MGNRSSGPARRELSEPVRQLAEEVFKAIDADGSLTIDRQETEKWWANNFARINSQALFNAVDSDHNGRIDLQEWLHFWTIVKSNGHTEAEIEEELLNIKSKGSWVGFGDVPQIAHQRD
jgi:Ca2+-binding EF-hand superfamily protein